MTKKLTYTEQVAAFREEQAAGFAGINARLDALVSKPAESAPVESAPPAVSGLTRSRSGSLPAIIKTPAELIATKMVPPFDAEFKRGAQSSIGDLTYVPGAWPSIYTDMGSTGDRDEIGLVTEEVADWLCDPSQRNVNNMLVWAESSGSVPIHWLDPDGYIYSVEKWPMVTSEARASKKDPLLPLLTKPVRADASHYPALAYVPYLVTSDHYYLEELQFAAAYHLIWNNPDYRKFDKGLLYTGQTRGYAWGLRDLFSAYLATPPGDVPAPLLPKDYWGRIIENNRIEFERRWVKNGDGNPLTGCHFAVDLAKDHVAPWQQDMLGAVLGWMIWTGDPLLAKWRPAYEWHMRQAIDRTSGKAGYPRSRAVQYYYKTDGVSDMASLAAVNGLTETPDGLIPTTDQNRAYTQYLRANLKMAALNGIPEAQECFAWLDPQVTLIPAKWAV